MRAGKDVELQSGHLQAAPRHRLIPNLSAGTGNSARVAHIKDDEIDNLIGQFYFPGIRINHILWLGICVYSAWAMDKSS
jgi:hypothetical protein